MVTKLQCTLMWGENEAGDFKEWPHFSVILVWKFTPGSMNFTNATSLKNAIRALNKGLLHTEIVTRYVRTLNSAYWFTHFTDHDCWIQAIVPAPLSVHTLPLTVLCSHTQRHTYYICMWHSYNSSLLSMSSKSMSERSMSSSGGNSPSLPSHGSVGLIFGNAAPFTGAVDPRPNERSLENDGTKSVFFFCLYSNNIHKCVTT